MQNNNLESTNTQSCQTDVISSFLVEKEATKFAKWCLLKRHCRRGYDWENVELLYEIYNDERKNNPDMNL